MSGFAHDLAGGNGNLVVTSVQSPNYSESAGTGWQIRKDGTATFYGVSIPNAGTGTTVTFSSTAPSSPDTGDVWYDTSNGLEANVWNGTAWTAYQISSGAIATGGIEPGNISNLTASLVGNVGVLNGNPYFLGGDATGWNGYEGTFSVTSSPASGCPTAYAGVWTSNGGSSGSAEESAGHQVAVVPGNQYMVSAWVYSAETDIKIGFDWTLNGSYVSTSVASVTVPASTWTQVSTVQTAPSSGVNACYARIGLETPAEGDEVQISSVLVMPQVPGSLIQAGTVEATQIAAGTVVSGIVNGTLIEGAEFVVDESGSGTGMFVYDATPGSGTAPVIAVTASDTDPFGNSTTPGDATTGKPQVIVTGAAPSGGTPTFIQMTPGSTSTSPAALQIGTGYASEITPGQIVSGISGSDPAALITAVLAPEAGSGDTSTSGESYLELFTSTNGAPGFGLSGSSEYGQYELSMQTASGTSGTYTEFSVSTDAGDVMILLPDLVLMTCQLVAQEPGSPGTSEAWHTVTPPSGWGGSGQHGLLRYQMTPFNAVRIQCTLTASTYQTTTNLSLFTLPSGYIPSSEAIVAVGTNNSTSAQARLQVSTAGAVNVIFGGSCSYSAVGFVADIPLD